MFPSGCFWLGADLLGLLPLRRRAQCLYGTGVAVSLTLGGVRKEKDPQDFGERKALHQPPLV